VDTCFEAAQQKKKNAYKKRMVRGNAQHNEVDYIS
jgi:hypothetical protein